MRWFALLLLSLTSTAVEAQDILFPCDGYRSDIPKPNEFFGYAPGERFTHYDRLESYLNKLDELSDRIDLRVYGKTPEGRNLVVAIVTSPSNHQRLDDIRRANLRLTDARVTKDEEAKKIIDAQPIFVWLTYNVHGNEASGTEAAIMVLYNLAAGEAVWLDSLLEYEVIFIDPLTNPDGRERYVNHVDARQGRFPNPDPNALEHEAVWPGGRWNHYYFDLNRDWSWLTQDESRSRVSFYQQWMPVFHGDFHEMGANSTYYFAPPTAPFNKFLDEKTFTKWANVYGRSWASAFDRHGWRYFTREIFDMHYPGFGDSWPSLNGALGVTFEQAGGVGVAYRRKDGHTLTLNERLTHHFITSWTTLKAAVLNRREQLNDFYDFWKSSLKWDGTARAYVIPREKAGAHPSEILRILLAQKIEVYETESSFPKLTSMSGQSIGSRSFQGGAYVIPLRQPKRRLLQALMEWNQIRSDSLFYDITAWSLPLAYHVETYQSETEPDLQKMTPVRDLPTRGAIPDAINPYAFLMDWNQEYAAQVCGELLRKNHQLQFTSVPLTLQGRPFARGTIVMLPGSQSGDLVTDLKRLVDKYPVRIEAVNTGWSDFGHDLGSNRIQVLQKPKIALLSGDPISAPDLGAIWFWLDRSQTFDFTLIDVASISRTDLDDYTVVICPAAWGSLDDYLGKSAVDRIKDWIEDGGVFIATGSSALWATKSKSGLTDLQSTGDKKADDKTSLEKEADRAINDRLKVMTRFEREVYEQKNTIPGTVLKVKIDPTHELGYGYDRDDIGVMMTGQNSFVLSSRGHNVARFMKEPLIAGYGDSILVRRLAETAYLVDEPVGKGHVVVYADDPVFRSFWMSMSRSVANAILFLRK
jgi:hypothetical protein